MKKITKTTINSIIRNGGATINAKGERVILRSGYQVSERDLLIIAVANFNKSHIINAMSELTTRGQYVGVWVDNGLVYVDISHRISTKKEALRQGKALNQLSILSWKSGECVAVE